MIRSCNKILKAFQNLPLPLRSSQLPKSAFFNSKAYLTLNNYRIQYNFSTKADDKEGDAEYVNFIFINKDKSEKNVRAKVGESLLEIAHQNDIDLEGACDSSLACSTCHVILESDIYDSLPEPKPEEEDMLDLAYGLTETSRLGCQVLVKKEFEGMKVTLPRATRNMYVDGHKPKHH